jgi:hypothetical protein
MNNLQKLIYLYTGMALNELEAAGEISPGWQVSEPEYSLNADDATSPPLCEVPIINAKKPSATFWISFDLQVGNSMEETEQLNVEEIKSKIGAQLRQSANA